MNQREELLRELAAAKARLADLATQNWLAESAVERIRKVANGKLLEFIAAPNHPPPPTSPAEEDRLSRALTSPWSTLAHGK
jgi:hypothetical protein